MYKIFKFFIGKLFVAFCIALLLSFGFLLFSALIICSKSLFYENISLLESKENLKLLLIDTFFIALIFGVIISILMSINYAIKSHVIFYSKI